MFLEVLSYSIAWGTMLRKWSLPCHSHLQTLPTQLLAASQQQAPLQGKHPKEKKCGPFSKHWHFTSPPSLVQSPFSSSNLISSLQMCTALPPPHLPMQACHKTFCTSCLLNLAYNQCTNKQPLQSLSALAEDRISRKAVASWKEVKKKITVVVFSDIDLATPLCIHSDQFYFQWFIPRISQFNQIQVPGRNELSL